MNSWMMKERKVVMMMFCALRVLLLAMRAEILDVQSILLPAKKTMEASLLPIPIPMRTHL